MFMRYKKGSRVEIFNKQEVPSGSWRCAKIVSGNGHYYTVRYDVYPGFTNKASVGRISRRSIRPCPPHVELTDDSISGQVLEVFHNFSWKMATVSKVLGRNSFLVRLIGTSGELKVRGFDVRVRQCWQDNKWILVGKGCGSYEDGKQNGSLNLKYVHDSGCWVKQTDTRMNLHNTNHFFDAGDNVYVQESCNVSSRILKRGSPCWYSQAEAQEGSAQKFMAAEKEGRSHRVARSSSPEKVEAIASTRELLRENHLHALFNNRTTYFPEMDVEREEQIGTCGCSCTISIEPNNSDSVSCSVGSCSVTSNSPHELLCHSSASEENGHCRKSESFCQLGSGKELFLPPSKEELAEEIHRLELHAYRSTIEVFHASGPLSWEQEILVTNLRIEMHISNDEHLIELKKLAKNCYRHSF